MTPSGESAALRLDEATRRASWGEAEIRLTRTEFAIVALLHREPGRVVSRAEIVGAVWGRVPFGDDHALDVHISRLRRKLSAAGMPGDNLRCIRGVGYLLWASYRPMLGGVATTMPGTVMLADAEGRIRWVSGGWSSPGEERDHSLLDRDIRSVLANSPSVASGTRLWPIRDGTGSVVCILIEVNSARDPEHARGPAGAVAGPAGVATG